MRKIRLDLGALEVESFATGAAERGGTVHANTGESCTCPTPVGYCLDTDPGGQIGGGTGAGCTYQCTYDWRNCGTQITACKPDNGTCQGPCVTAYGQTCQSCLLPTYCWDSCILTCGC